MLKRSHSRHTEQVKPYKAVISFLVLTIISVLSIKWFGSDLTPKVAVADTQETSQSSSRALSSSTVEVELLTAKIEKHEPSKQSSSSASSSQETVTSQPEIQTEASLEAVEETIAPLSEEVAPVEEVVVTERYYSEVPTEVTVVTGSYPTVLGNGNTAGAIGTEAAARMAAATGVPQETWEYIIARESNGDPNVSNPSGASGLFQTMPGWGSTATVDEQINAALNAYNNQGLAAWGMP